MTMIVTCPCGRQLRLGDEFAGELVRCPLCQQVFRAPGGEVVAPPSEVERVTEPPAVPQLEIGPPERKPEPKPEPATYDLAPIPKREQSPRRPSRPARHREEDEEPEPAPVRRARRDIRTSPVVRRGLQDWKGTRPCDLIGILLLIGGVALLVVSIQNMRLANASSSVPQRITLAQLIARGPGDNAHVIVTDFIPARNYVYLYQKGKYEVVNPADAERRRWTEVYVPLVPLTPEMRARAAAGGNVDNFLQPRSVRAVVRLSLANDKASVERWCEDQMEVQGMVVNLTQSLSGQTERLLRESYPDTDFSRCLIIHEGKTPSSPVLIVVGSAAGVLLFVVAGLWFIARLVFRGR